MTKKQECAIRAHGLNLQAIFPDSAGFDPVKLCKRLRRIERKAHKAAEDYCNGLIGAEDWEDVDAEILEKVDTLLHFRSEGVPVFVNGDPRGYALKIDSEWMGGNNCVLYHDWGGYGIIAPEIER